MRKTGKFTKRVAVIGTVAALAVGGGVAWAAWTSTGTGSGSAQAGEAKKLDVKGGKPATSLFPGATADVVFVVTNPNSYPVKITTVASSGAIETNAKDCNVAESVRFAAPKEGSFGVVPAGKDLEIVVPKSVTMNNLANDKCQNAAFTIPITVTGVSDPGEKSPVQPRDVDQT